MNAMNPEFESPRFGFRGRGRRPRPPFGADGPPVPPVPPFAGPVDDESHIGHGRRAPQAPLRPGLRPRPRLRSRRPRIPGPARTARPSHVPR